MTVIPRSWSTLLVGGVIALLLNAAYLAYSNEASLVYLANVTLHPILGLVLAGAVIARLSRAFRVTGLATAALVIIGVGVLLGIGVLVFGATRPYRRLLDAHIVASIAGSAVLIVYLWRAASARVGLVVAAVALFVAAIGPAAREAQWRQSYRIENPDVVPAAMEHEGGGPASPFFPSSADTNLPALEANQDVAVQEGKGVVRATPFVPRLVH